MGRKVLIVVLIVLVPLTACLMFAAGDVVLPHSWSKRAHGASHGVVRLPFGVATPTIALASLVLVGRLAMAAPPEVTSVAPQPPFVPPRG
jgi:hypothetical protein